MKFLTLNTHSWMEKNPEEKFQLLFQDILENSYDLICFQEINQEITSTQVESGPLYNPLLSAEPIHQDHYVRLLVEKLSEKGLDFIGHGLIIISDMTVIMREFQFYLKHRLRRVRFWFQM